MVVGWGHGEFIIVDDKADGVLFMVLFMVLVVLGDIRLVTGGRVV